MRLLNLTIKSKNNNYITTKLSKINSEVLFFNEILNFEINFNQKIE